MQGRIQLAFLAFGEKKLHKLSIGLLRTGGCFFNFPIDRQFWVVSGRGGKYNKDRHIAGSVDSRDESCLDSSSNVVLQLERSKSKVLSRHKPEIINRPHSTLRRPAASKPAMNFLVTEVQIPARTRLSWASCKARKTVSKITRMSVNSPGIEYPSFLFLCQPKKQLCNTASSSFSLIVSFAYQFTINRH